MEFKPRQTWPNSAYAPGSSELDPPMLAAYYSDQDFTHADEEGVFYREVNPTRFADTSILYQVGHWTVSVPNLICNVNSNPT